ncbi:hypothetical protein WJX73_007383 [Symbiochloris irregularis]|uniref:Vacuolar import/degradation Vid27 C-terminal domain-containing protein n=1 Tax=Symbiochloris irregularis TaxID=706552 RepID=A0AAW1PI95_9CHLO
MGTNVSKQPEPVPEDVAESSGPITPGQDTVKLFKYDEAGRSWDTISASCSPHFYDRNEDSATSAKDWALEAADLDCRVMDDFSSEPAVARVIIKDDSNAVWALKFPSARHMDGFLTEYNGKLFENVYGKESKPENLAKLFGEDNCLNLGQQETLESQNAWYREAMDTEATPAKEERLRKDREVAARDAISGVRMGVGDRSYLVREGQIDVLRNVHGGVQDAEVSFAFTPPGQSRPPRGGALSGTTYTPSKLMLTHGERRMNMLTPDRANKVLNADLETGKVVSEWGFQKDGIDVEMRDVTNDTKAAQMDERNTFLGIGQNRLVKWDMRDPSGVVQEMNSPPIVGYAGGKDYARNTNFTCMATSGDGYVVVGAHDGQVRLYSERTLTRANTAIPGLGAPISSVDVTYDGKWVVATTKSYIMVVNTSFQDKNGKQSCAFTSRMGARGPKPRLLRLKPEDVAVVQGAPLQKGKFTWVTEAGRQERWIVASVGNYSVLWNFKTVQRAKPDVVSYGGLTTVSSYHLIPKSDAVVDSVFMHDKYASPTKTPGLPSQGNDDAAMVILTKHKVFSMADDSDED